MQHPPRRVANETQHAVVDENLVGIFILRNVVKIGFTLDCEQTWQITPFAEALRTLPTGPSIDNPALSPRLDTQQTWVQYKLH